MGRKKQFFTKRRCNFCGEVKPIEEFRKNKRIACGYDSKCKSCHNAALRKRRLTSHLAKFGLTISAYEVLLEKQGGDVRVLESNDQQTTFVVRVPVPAEGGN